jgi:hypothetical protein
MKVGEGNMVLEKVICGYDIALTFLLVDFQEKFALNKDGGWTF